MQAARGTALIPGPVAAEPGAPILPRPPAWWTILGLSLAVAGLDQATKAWALAELGDGRTVPLLGRWLQLRLTVNAGAAFSFGKGATWVFTLLTVIVIAGVLTAMRRVTSRAWVAAGVMVLGGGAGNLVDRLIRPPGVGVGRVVDFIAYGDWFIGNVADIALVGAVGLMLILSLRGVKPWQGDSGPGEVTPGEVTPGDVTPDEVTPDD